MTTCKVSLWSSLSNLIDIYSAIDGYIYMSNTELASLFSQVGLSVHFRR